MAKNVPIPITQQIADWCQENDVDVQTLKIDFCGPAIMMRGFSAKYKSNIGNLKIHAIQ